MVWTQEQEDNLRTVTVSGETIHIPKVKSLLIIGDTNYVTSIPTDRHFNWFQKLMWQWFFGIKVTDYNEE